MVDMFAKMSNKLPVYVSPIPDSNVVAVDAFNVSWEALEGYAYCSIVIIPNLMWKTRTYACQMIVVAPVLPGRAGFGT